MTMATAVKVTLLKWICVFSSFIAIIPTLFKCQIKVKFPGVEFLETASSLERELKKIRPCHGLFMSSTKRPIRKFHVLVVQ